MTTPKGFQATEVIGVGLINVYQCSGCQAVVDCLMPPESHLCPTCRGKPSHFEKVREPVRECAFCGQSPALYRITRLTPEQRQANQAWAESFKDGFHTGHCPHLELPTYACHPCYYAHPESHLYLR